MGEELDVLLREAKRGNRTAFALFVRSTQREVWSFCARIAGRDEADDATQETYVGAWRSLRSFRGESSARTWLFQIARRSAWRTARRRDRWSEAATSLMPLPSQTQPGGRLELEEALAELDVDRRTAFVLTQLLGFSYAEAAAICECPIGTVRSRVARARETLLTSQADAYASAG